MRTAICTISSSSHLFKADALFRSLKGRTSADLFNLVTDGPSQSTESGQGVILKGLSSLSGEVATRIVNRYKGDALRWGCKPLLIRQLLLEGYDKVIYVDNDICFYASPDFLFEMLEDHAVMLTPHFYPADPSADQQWLEANFRVGLYNAGFVAVGQGGASAMQWWAECCAYNIRKSSWRGLFDDQKYLDLMPVLFDRVHVLKHKGCNVAGWNSAMSPRSTAENGNIIIDGIWPLVFVHFNAFSVRSIKEGKDTALAKLLDDYLRMLTDANPKFAIDHEIGYGMNDASLALRHMLWKIQRFLVG